MSERDSTSHFARWCLLLGAAFLIVIGLLMTGLGLWLASLGGSWYYLMSNGYMATGTQTINGKTYTFNASGKWVQ